MRDRLLRQAAGIEIGPLGESDMIKRMQSASLRLDGLF